MEFLLTFLQLMEFLLTFLQLMEFLLTFLQLMEELPTLLDEDQKPSSSSAQLPPRKRTDLTNEGGAPSTYTSAPPTLCLSVCLAIYRSIHASTDLSTYLFIYLTTFKFNLGVCLFL
jgi:hypothetical protein